MWHEIYSFFRSPKRFKNGGTFRVHSDRHKIFKCTLYLRQTDTNGVVQTDGREGVLDEASREQHNITEAAPNELKLGESG